MYSVKYNNVFFFFFVNKFRPFLLSSGQRYTKYKKTLVTRSVHKFQVVWDPIYTNVKIC
jgi:hypothetical protein